MYNHLKIYYNPPGEDAQYLCIKPTNAMGYTTLSIRRKNTVRKYILFYADYLDEAWLSEVRDDGSTRIVKQFKCKSLFDLNDLARYISRNGDIVKLSTEENAEVYLKILEKQLTKKPFELYLEKLNLMFASCRVLLQKRPRIAMS